MADARRLYYLDNLKIALTILLSAAVRTPAIVRKVL